MRLGSGDIKVTVGALAPQLRPSLRAAFRLEQKHGGFDNLIRSIVAGDWRVVSDVIVESSEPSVQHHELVRAIERIPLKDVIPDLTESLMAHVFALAGIDPDKPAQDAEGERITFADHHTKLYRQATGWLGWTPKEAWAATPAEIEEAFTGRMELLRAIFGSAEEKDHVPDKPDKAKLDRKGLAKLKGKGRAR